MHILPLYGGCNKSAMLSAIGEANGHELMSWDSAVGPKGCETPITYLPLEWLFKGMLTNLCKSWQISAFLKANVVKIYWGHVCLRINLIHRSAIGRLRQKCINTNTVAKGTTPGIGGCYKEDYFLGQPQCKTLRQCHRIELSEWSSAGECNNVRQKYL